MTGFARFAGDEGGAVTVDWTVITAGLLLMGTMVIYTIFNSGGVDGLVSNSNESLGGTGPTVVVRSMSEFDSGSTDSTDDGSGGDSGTCIGSC